MTEGESKIGISLIPLNACEKEKSASFKYDVLNPEKDNKEKIGSVQLSLLLKESRRISIISKVNESDEKILKETTKKAFLLNSQTMSSLTPLLLQENKEDINERMKPGPSEYQLEIDLLQNEELSFFQRKRLQKLKKKDEKRKKLEPFLKKFLNLPEPETLRLNKVACTLKNVTLSDSKVGVAFLFTNNLCFKVPNEKFNLVVDICKIEKVEIHSKEFAFTHKGIDYKLTERSPVKVLLPLLRARFAPLRKDSSITEILSPKEKEEMEESEDDEDIDDESIFTLEDSKNQENFLVADEFEKVYTDVELKCSPVKFFKIFCSDDSKDWEISLNELKGNSKIEVSSWTSSNKTSFKREISYIAPVSGGPPFCPKETYTLEKQKYILNKDKLIHEKLLTMSDIPYSKNFGIEQRIIAKTNGENSLLLTAEIGIRWFNKPSFIVSGQIKSTSLKKMVISLKSWLDKIKNDLESVSKSEPELLVPRKSVKISSEIKEIPNEPRKKDVPNTNNAQITSVSSLANPKSSFVQSNLFLISYVFLYLIVIYIALKVGK
eukprot:TRINITY_DN10711_c0_g1_i1.p1 TRINITY_DN10711_c0_g1~~TRINITY_DN10711_c0_g1_i1.p1  ORF type:complete len:622 (-),score=178.26 TRINITY_DN10711_c0_g1_i1:27-1673(-)